MEDIQLGDVEERVLRALFSLNGMNCDWVYTYQSISDEMDYHTNHLNHVPKRYIVKAMKVLRELDLAYYTSCMSEDEYLVAGSGHRITPKGIALLSKLDLEVHK